MKPLFTILIFAGYSTLCHAQCPASGSLFAKDTLIICADTTYTLSLPAGAGIAFSWSTGENTNSIKIDQSGEYWVTQAQAGCPPVSDTISLLFNSLILEPLVHDTILCLNQPAPALVARGEKLLWYTSPLAATGSISAPVPSTADTGTTAYYVSQNILGCESPRARLTVEVINSPAFDLGDDILIPCGVKAVVLQTVPEKYTGYRWQDGTTASELLATEAGKYTLKASNICGSFTDTVQIVLCNTHCLSFPNAFTPNNDGLNESFRPGAFCPVTTYSFSVYDRFGKKVFETNNPAAGWDGYIAGRKADPGNYVYYCIYDDFMLKKELLLKGTVTLIR